MFCTQNNLNDCSKSNSFHTISNFIIQLLDFKHITKSPNANNKFIKCYRSKYAIYIGARIWSAYSL
jgi:hypothetical protein